MRKVQIEELFRRLAAANPAPRSELHYRDPFTLLCAVALSAQATDKGVNKATPALFAAAGTPKKMAALGVAGVKRHIRTIGLFNNKAKNLVRLSEILLERFGGRVPDNRADLESLPGVGRKTASVVLNTAFGHPTIAVDTHVFRVARRLGLATGKTPRAVEEELERVVPAPYRKHAHHWLLLHGRHLCKARRPDCPRCLVRDLCPYGGKTAPAFSPASATEDR